MGAGTSIMPSQAIKDKYNKEFSDVRSRIKCYWYSVEDSYIAHVIIPSSSTEGLAYDVVFEFGDISNSRDIKDNKIRVFSNAPSFIYTYAKVFKDQGILIDWLEDKYTDKVLTLDPTTRNRYKLVSYEKSLYLACLYIASNRSISLSAKMNTIVFSDYAQVSSRIKSEKTLKNKRDRIKKKEKKEAARKNIRKSTNESNITSSEDAKPASTVKTVKKTATTKKTPSASKRIKTTKKVKKI